MKKTEDVLYIVMPAYNEGKNIRETVKAWIKVLDGKSKKSRLVVADSGSTDNTHEILLKLQKEHKNLQILQKTNQYHGPKVLALYRYAVENGADYIFQTDSDGQTDPMEFDAFWQERKQYDAILGHRNHRGDGRLRTFVEKIVCLMLRLFFDVNVPDANAPFRLMKSSLTAKFIDRFPPDYDIPNIILTAYFVYFEKKITFKTISFKPRTAGINSINFRKIFKTGIAALSSFFRFRKDMQKTNPYRAKQIKHHKLATLAILVIFGFAALFITTVSPSHPWNRGEPATDSGVFLTIGTQMKAGLLPYRDTFDHKGPLLFIINFLGVSLNPTSGILVFECLAIFTCFIALYKIARLKCSNRLLSVVIAFLSMTLYVLINKTERGNLTEEYALPFIAISLYIFIDYFLRHQTTAPKVFLAGVCFMGIALLRINMVIFLVVPCFAIFLQLLSKKSFRTLRKFIFEYLLGAIALAAPFFIWMVSNGILDDFFSSYIVFNMAYSASTSGIAPILSSAQFFASQVPTMLALVLSVALLALSKQKSLAVIFLFTFLAAIATAAMSGRVYPHYGIILVPFLAFPLATFCKKLISVERQGYFATALIAVVIMLLHAPWCDLADSVLNTFAHRHTGEPITESTAKACELTQTLTNPEDKISVYGNRNAFYLLCNRLPATRYSYQYPIGDVRPSILDEYFRELKADLPKIIVVQAGHNDTKITEFVEENNYKEEWRESIDSGTIVYSKISR